MVKSFLKVGQWMVLSLVVASNIGCGGGGGTSVPTPTSFSPTPAPTTSVLPTPVSLSTLKVACLGDSITYGYGLTARETTSYPVVLGNLLGSNYQVENFGANGATVFSEGRVVYANQIAYLQAQKANPDIVVVELGTNDSNYNLNDATKAKFVAEYKALLAPFVQTNPQVRIYVCLPLPSYHLTNTIQNTNISTQIIPLLRQIAQELGAQVVDLNTPFTGHTEWFIDGLHPNPQGAQVIAQTVYAVIAGQQTPD